MNKPRLLKLIEDLENNKEVEIGIEFNFRNPHTCGLGISSRLYDDWPEPDDYYEPYFPSAQKYYGLTYAESRVLFNDGGGHEIKTPKGKMETVLFSVTKQEFIERLKYFIEINE